MPPEPLYLSASGIDRFSACETRWLLNREIGESDAAPSDPMRLGTLLHRLVQSWWRTGDWLAEYQTALSEEPGWEPEYEDPELFVKAAWIMDRYDTVYRDANPDWRWLGAEVSFDLPLTKGVRVRGYIDGFVSRPEGLGLWEVKSMGRWGRENRVPFDPQLGIYLWAAHELGWDVQGAIFDAISTYKYAGKKDKDGNVTEPPAPEKSFKRIEVPYDQRFVDRCIDNALRVAKRGQAIVKNPSLAVRAVGDQCTWCPYFTPCHRPWELEAA